MVELQGRIKVDSTDFTHQRSVYRSRGELLDVLKMLSRSLNS